MGIVNYSLAIGDPELTTELGLLDNTPFAFYNDERTHADLAHQRALSELAANALYWIGC